jgi:hypothetical protein
MVQAKLCEILPRVVFVKLLIRGAFNIELVSDITQVVTNYQHFFSKLGGETPFDKELKYIYIYMYEFQGGLGSSVGIATAYGLEGPGIESRWGRDFPHLSRPAPRPAQSSVQWVSALSRG